MSNLDKAQLEEDITDLEFLLKHLRPNEEWMSEWIQTLINEKQKKLARMQ